MLRKSYIEKTTIINKTKTIFKNCFKSKLQNSLSKLIKIILNKNLDCELY